jgi:hypothetical protein
VKRLILYAYSNDGRHDFLYYWVVRCVGGSVLGGTILGSTVVLVLLGGIQQNSNGTRPEPSCDVSDSAHIQEAVRVYTMFEHVKRSRLRER